MNYNFIAQPPPSPPAEKYLIDLIFFHCLTMLMLIHRYSILILMPSLNRD